VDVADTPLDWFKFFTGGVAGAVVVGIGLYQYVATSTQTAQKPFLEKQTDLCFHASETVARLATTTVPDDWKKQWDEFWMLYWGPLAIVEDKNGDSLAANPTYGTVAQRMIQFGNPIKDAGRDPGHLPYGDLTRPAIQVSKACQVLVTSWWETGFSRWLPGIKSIGQ
jgi:hypothetical protein